MTIGENTMALRAPHRMRLIVGDEGLVMCPVYGDQLESALARDMLLQGALRHAKAARAKRQMAEASLRRTNSVLVSLRKLACDFQCPVRRSAIERILGIEIVARRLCREKRDAARTELQCLGVLRRAEASWRVIALSVTSHHVEPRGPTDDAGAEHDAGP